MATSTPAKPARKRVKLHKFDVPSADAIAKLVADGKLRAVEIDARPATEKRKAQPARTDYVPESRAGVLGLYGGNEKAANLGATLYWATYVKRMNSKGKVADPDRAVNRTAETFERLDLSSMPDDVRKAAEVFKAYAKQHPVAPVKRKAKTPKS